MSDIPLTNFHFQVEWGGQRLGFSEVTGLTMEHEVIEYRDGMNKDFTTLKVPGLRKYSNVVMKRGMYLGDNEFFEWWNTVGIQVAKRDIRVTLLNENHEPTVSWSLRNAWPVTLQTSALNALKSAILIERLELAHEGITIKNQ